MSELMVSAGEAARRLGVAPATIQRWVDSGVLHAERTRGGHRRIYVTELQGLIAASRPAELGVALAHWLDVLLAGDPAGIRSALIVSRQRTGSWAETADEVAAAIAEIGRRWEAGDCPVFDEHVASEALHRAAAACVADMSPVAGTRSAVLFSVADDRHTLGLSLAELVLAEFRWHTTWIGEGPPPDELQTLVAKRNPDLLVVSCSGASKPAHVHRYQSELVEIATGRGLILGGGGPWRPTLAAKQVVTFKDFQTVLADQPA